MRALCLLSALLLGLAAGAARAELVELENCTDATGKVVPVERDPSFKMLVQSELQGGRRLIRYNPDALPNLSAAAKQFFFAHECAKVSLGAVPGTELTASRARNADCVGLATLRAAGLFKEPGTLAALQAELVFSEEEWSQLPGPHRAFDLMACPKQAAVVLPIPKSPSQDQLEWNTCVRQCGDRLLRCRGGDDCQRNYDRCEAACKLH